VIETGLRKRRRRRPLRPKASFAKVDDPVARIEAIIARAWRKLQEAFVRMVTRVRDASTLHEIEILVNAGRIDEAVALGEAAYLQFAGEWIEVYVLAAKDTAGFIGRELSVIATFDQTNVRAVQAMQANRLRLIREVTQAQTETIREVLVEGVRAGLNPRQVAREFRSSIGLTRKQQQYVANYRAELEALDARALGRQLRDRRFDRTLARAIDFESPLDRGQIDRMVTRYRERWIKYRAEVVGRTEGLRSVHEGVEEMYRQGIDSGAIDPESFVRVWNTALDGRVRDFEDSATSHRTMHGQEQRIGSPFVSGAGNQLRYPGDPNAPAVDTVQCRCVLSARFQEGP
jgi:hypothetical protein